MSIQGIFYVSAQVSDLARSRAFYAEKLGFTVDWGRDGGDIAGISRDDCRLFLTNPALRSYFGNTAPTVFWINLDSERAVDALHAEWIARGATVLHPPEAKSWSRLYEFVATDPDRNSIRVFFNF